MIRGIIRLAELAVMVTIAWAMGAIHGLNRGTAIWQPENDKLQAALTQAQQSLAADNAAAEKCLHSTLATSGTITYMLEPGAANDVNSAERALAPAEIFDGLLTIAGHPQMGRMVRSLSGGSDVQVMHPAWAVPQKIAPVFVGGANSDGFAVMYYSVDSGQFSGPFAVDARSRTASDAGERP
jgi:hypothetical protein